MRRNSRVRNHVLDWQTKSQHSGTGCTHTGRPDTRRSYRIIRSELWRSSESSSRSVSKNIPNNSRLWWKWCFPVKKITKKPKKNYLNWTFNSNSNRPLHSLYWLIGGVIGPHVGGIVGAWLYLMLIELHHDTSGEIWG
jgi:hypothetical protein